MADENSLENRRHPRANVVVSVRTTDPSSPSPDQSTNLSESGMFIHTNKIYSIGVVVGVELILQGQSEAPLFVKGRVVRVTEPGGDKPSGMGVEFFDVPPRERSRIRRLVWGAMGGSATILLMTQDKRMEKMIKALLAEHQHNVIVAAGFRDLSDAAREGQADLILFDLTDVEQGFRVLRAAAADLPLIVICRRLEREVQARAASLGIFELIEKPVGADRLLAAINRELQSIKLEKVSGNSPGQAESQKTISLVARSPAMQEVVKQIMALGQVPQPVLIVGETGVGKEVVARTLHRTGPRRTRRFEIADCTMMDKNLMASMLFGHEKGSFTSAEMQHKGVVEQSGDGVLFLDEIGELSMESQSKLLRLLESGSYRRLGGDRDMICKARIIAATNRDLRTMVRDGQFREDLLYRLQVHTIMVPALKKRREDLINLSHLLLNELNQECKTMVYNFGPVALQQIISYDWPGNVRELRNAIAASLIGVENETIEELKIQSDPIMGTAESDSGSHAQIKGDLTWEEFLQINDTQMKKYLNALMTRFNGVITAAASHIGMTRQNLSKKIKEHGISPADFRDK